MTIKKVVVAGGGVLGSQIALQSAYCGFDVTIWLRSEGSIERAKPKLERFKNIYIDTLEQMKTDTSAYCRGLTDKTDLSDPELDELKQKAQTAYDSLTLTTSYEDAAADADLIIEAIAENPEQKIEGLKNTWHFILQIQYGRTTPLKSWDIPELNRNTMMR